MDEAQSIEAALNHCVEEIAKLREAQETIIEMNILLWKALGGALVMIKHPEAVTMGSHEVGRKES